MNGGNQSITVCHHSASPVMPIGDPRDGFFYPTLILMMYSYNMRVIQGLGPGKAQSSLRSNID